MSEIIHFVAKHELSPQQNLNEFIALARDQLTLWSNLEGFAWKADRWPTIPRAVRFTNFEHSDLHPRASLEPHQLMHPVFTELAKSYLRYRHSLRPHSQIHRELTALRALEFALRQTMAIPDIIQFKQRHWELAVSALEPFAARQSYCSEMLVILKALADFSILTVNPRFWKNPYVGLNSYDRANGALAPSEVKIKKNPNQDALLAMAEVFSQGASGEQEDVDTMLTCLTGLLLSAPMRFSETLRFRTNCLRNEKDKNGESQYYLAYWVPKTQQFARKPIPATMVEVAAEAIKRVFAITEEGRRLARYMETNPTKYYRHPNCPDVSDDQELTTDQLIQALDFTSRAGCQVFIKRHTGKETLKGFTLDSLWKMVLTEHRALNPYFPYQEASDSRSHPPLKMSESLLCFRRFQLARNCNSSPVLLAPFNRSYYATRLRKGTNNDERNFFMQNGYETIELKSHSLRHLLNKLGRSCGVSIEMLTEWSSRATTRQTRTYLHDGQAAAATKGAIVLGICQEQKPHNPVTEQEAEVYGQGPFHRSRYGICRRSWRAGPCNKFADCLNCSELLMCKGDNLAVEIIKLDRDNLAQTYIAAQQAIADGERAASRWTEKAGLQIERLDELLTTLENPQIPDGSPIQITGQDFSHEKVIVLEKANAARVKLLDRNELGITYSKELLACLDLLWNPDNG